MTDHYKGSTLALKGLQRTDMGSYLCIAANSIPPTKSRRYEVSVLCKYHTNIESFFYFTGVFLSKKVKVLNSAVVYAMLPRNIIINEKILKINFPFLIWKITTSWKSFRELFLGFHASEGRQKPLKDHIAVHRSYIMKLLIIIFELKLKSNTLVY